MKKAWMYVFLTSFFELVWILGFNIADAWWHWIFIITFIIMDLHFLTKACEQLPTGTVYAIFAAAGTVGTALMDVYIFGGDLTSGKMMFMVLLVLGVIGLKLADEMPENKSNEGSKEVMH
ncbi:DMT family transporter [Virgibacillus alimentarius]|uniref:DMT family transporter n=1 Tax=Virgibacillus alimentarius TaxID=698769 RepID=UPI0004935CA5|nr:MULTISPECIES: SMR family transporter [Virgibacillus]HLR69329.1 SMR family transporter [Virgibacillus sp.]